jgi:HEAT repeat protein
MARSDAPPGREPDLATLREALLAKSWRARRRAVWTLPLQPVTDVLPLLEIAIRDGHEDVRMAAVETLGDVHDRRAAEMLKGVVDRGRAEDEFVRREAVLGLAAHATPEAFDALERVARDEKERFVVRSEAILALGRSGDPARWAALRDVHADAPRRIRREIEHARIRPWDNRLARFLATDLFRWSRPRNRQ